MLFSYLIRAVNIKGMTGLDPGILDRGGYKSHTHNHTHINYNEN
jgi:hypothetical protein